MRFHHRGRNRHLPTWPSYRAQYQPNFLPCFLTRGVSDFPDTQVVIIPFATQNMTEGPVPHELHRAGIFVGQEISRSLVREGFPPRYKHFFPDRDPHQCISWDPDLLDVHHRGWVRFHQSGEAEGWPYHTPARGMVFVKGRLRGIPDSRIVVFGVWFLNSWWPVHPDIHTRHRRHVVEDLCLPVLRHRLDLWHRAGYAIIGGGDTNSLDWPGLLRPYLRPVWSGGLDRQWFTDEHFKSLGRHEGPRTGTGTQMRHHSRFVELALRPRTERASLDRT